MREIGRILHQGLLIITGILLLFASGCTHNITIDPTYERQIDILERKAGKRSARLFLPRDTMEVDKLSFEGNKVTYRKVDSDTLTSINLGDITRYQFKDHLGGAMEGAFLGGASTAALYGIGSLLGEIEGYGALAWIQVGVLSGIGGLLIGAGIGSTFKYHPPDSLSNRGK